MNVDAGNVADPHTALYQATLDQVVQSAEAIMGKVLATARQSLKDQSTQARGFGEREHFEQSRKLLENYANTLSERYPQALRTAFVQVTPVGVTAGPLLKDLRFDQLELMDSAQVQERVALARAQQSVQLAADAALPEFNTYICAVMGMTAVQPERNPLRPEIFVQALQGLLAQLYMPELVRLECLQAMSEGLGKELSQLYRTLSAQLQAQGVTAAGYGVVRRQERAGALRRDESAHASQDTTLTLDRLRRLLAGELLPAPVDPRVASFAAQFSNEFESGDDEPPSTDFASTVPAAFEALQEMQQVDRVMERFDKRSQANQVEESTAPASPAPVKKRTDNGLSQALSQEVVALMVENMAHDARLLEPIKEVVKAMEPALLRLSLVDPRFFTDKQHPARRLLLDITQRSLAYDRVAARGFAEFLAPLQQAVSRLVDLPIDDADPFEHMRQELVQLWDQRKPPQQLAQAVQALQYAEERNLLAEQIADEIQVRPDAAHVAGGVLDFLCGPWAQVVAHAQLNNPQGADDPGHYRELVAALLWSAKPEVTSKNIAKLTRLVPKLLGKLREGLQLIDYPSLKTSEFFELLMNLHQQAFKPVVKAPEPPPVVGLLPSLLAEADPWLAPSEAKASGFMELSEDLPAPPVVAPVELLPMPEMPTALPAEFALPVGAWVEMRIKDVWVRAQLSWASPHGTLFLFTSAYGSTQSMTRRSRDRLLANGTMRVVSDQPVVDGALDAVVQSAMLNSLDLKL